MNKLEFLRSVESKLQGLSQKDIDKSLEYYSEMIDDRIEEGMSEYEAVSAMGSADEIASQILMDTPIPKLIKAKAKPSRALRVWEIVLLILGSPLWLSLLLTVIAVFLSIYIVIWAVVIVLYAADFSIAAVALGGIIGSLILAPTGQLPLSMLFFGAGLVCAGVSILLFMLFNLITLGVAKLSKLIVLWVKSWFVRKGESK